MDHGKSQHLLDAEEGAIVLTQPSPGPEIRGSVDAQRGFTLIELIVTITLLGLLVALSLPSFTAWIRNSQVRSVAEALQNGLRLAQAEAVRRNHPVVMLFTNDANPTTNPSTPSGSFQNWSIQTMSSRFSDGGAITFVRAGTLSEVASSVTISGPSKFAICFSANGRVIADAAPAASPSTAECLLSATTFAISQASSDRPLNVNVALGGQVRMCDPNRPALSATSPDGC